MQTKGLDSNKRYNIYSISFNVKTSQPLHGEYQAFLHINKYLFLWQRVLGEECSSLILAHHNHQRQDTEIRVSGQEPPCSGWSGTKRAWFTLDSCGKDAGNGKFRRDNCLRPSCLEWLISFAVYSAASYGGTFLLWAWHRCTVTLEDLISDARFCHTISFCISLMFIM